MKPYRKFPPDVPVWILLGLFVLLVIIAIARVT